MCQRCKNTVRIRGSGPLREMERACANSKRKLEPAYLGPKAVVVGTPAWMNGHGDVSRAAGTFDTEVAVRIRKLRTPQGDRIVAVAGEPHTFERPGGLWFLAKPVVGLSDAARKAELTRQARRLAGQAEADDEGASAMARAA